MTSKTLLPTTLQNQSHPSSQPTAVSTPRTPSPRGAALNALNRRISASALLRSGHAFVPQELGKGGMRLLKVSELLQPRGSSTRGGKTRRVGEEETSAVFGRALGVEECRSAVGGGRQVENVVPFPFLPNLGTCTIPKDSMGLSYMPTLGWFGGSM